MLAFCIQKACDQQICKAAGNRRTKQHFAEQEKTHWSDLIWRSLVISPYCLSQVLRELYTATLALCNFSVVCDSLTPIYIYICHWKALFLLVQHMLDAGDITFSLTDIGFLLYLSFIPTNTCNSWLLYL